MNPTPEEIMIIARRAHRTADRALIACAVNIIVTTVNIGLLLWRHSR